MTEARVIGAGLSGLATAWYLTEAGVRVHVVDAASSPGGLIHTTRTPDGLVESAAPAFVWNDRVSTLFQAVGLDPCFANETSRRRYIFRDGKPNRWPLSVAESAGAVARFGWAWVSRTTRPRAHDTVEAWGHRVFGRAATRWLIGPALQGVYATAPDKLSAAAIFGSKRRRRGKLAAPAEGMGALMTRLHDRLVDRGATFEFGAAIDRLDDSIPTAVCTNAPSAARLLAPHAPELASAINRIRMVSLLSVTAFFPVSPNDLRGFGVLFPRGSVEALGVLFNADIFPGRSDVRSETWIYGDLQPDRLPQGDAAILARLSADRRVFCGRDEPALAIHAGSVPAALPVYDAAVSDAHALRSTLSPRIAIAGNYLGRLGVSALVDEAAEAANRLVRAVNV